MIVLDNFLLNPCRTRRNGLKADFIDWPGPDGEVYKRIAIGDVPGVQEGIEQAIGPVEMLGMAYRLNYGGENPNAAIHSDLGWGTHAAVVYLSEGEGGTAFWRHKATGTERYAPDLYEQVIGDVDNPEAWEQTGLCDIRFNRAVIYESALFHSRWPFGAFGDSPETGRLIVVAFFNKEG